MAYTVAVVGATGAVGTQMIKQLEAVSYTHLRAHET